MNLSVLCLFTDRPYDCLPLILNMLIGNLLCLFYITITDCFVNFFMFFDEKISCLFILQILHTVTINLFPKIIQYLIQSSVIRRFINHFVKCHIGLCKLDQITLCHSCFEVFGRFPQFRQLFLCHTCTCIFNRKIFQSNSNFQNIIQIFLCDIGNLCTSSGNHHNQTFQFQFSHSFPYRSPADTKTFCKCNFHQSFSWLQFAF